MDCACPLHHQQVAVCYSVLLVLQCVAVCCSVLQCVAMCCSVSQYGAVYCSVLQRVAVCCSAYEQLIAHTLCSVCTHSMQCVAVCCSVLQCVAVCCSVPFTTLAPTQWERPRTSKVSSIDILKSQLYAYFIVSCILISCILISCMLISCMLISFMLNSCMLISHESALYFFRVYSFHSALKTRQLYTDFMFT